MGNPARLLPVPRPVKGDVNESEANQESIDLQPPRLLVEVRAKREVQKREVKAPTVNLAASQKAERQLALSVSRGSRSAERKKARGLHRQEGHNNFTPHPTALEQNPGAGFCSVVCGKRQKPPERPAQAPLQQFSNLHGVQCCALEQLIA
jgi:hypothetical protein